jgi:hypothetical protein
MARVLVPLILALLPACGSTPSTPRKRPPPECECSEKKPGCDCPHCMSEESGMEPAACPCGHRGFK